MDTIVLKFGGSSLADNEKLQIVANKIIKRAEQYKIVVVVSAQGKTTDKLIEQAKEIEEMVEKTEQTKILKENSNQKENLSERVKEINMLAYKREFDMLVSTGEQISAAKLSLLLNLMGYKSISLNSWQVRNTHEFKLSKCINRKY